MKKEYTEIFWNLYAIKKDAEVLQEEFMPNGDRALLEDFIIGCQWYNLPIVFWPNSFEGDLKARSYDDKFFDVNSLHYSAKEINWNKPESYKLKLSLHIKVLIKVMKIINYLRHTRVNDIEDKTTPLKDLLLDFCDLWEKYIIFFWKYLEFSISIGRLSKLIKEYETLYPSLTNYSIDKKISFFSLQKKYYEEKFKIKDFKKYLESKKTTWLDYQKKYFEARLKIKEFYVLHEELSSELLKKEKEEKNIKNLMEDNDKNFEETKDDKDEIDESDIGYVYFIRNKDLYKIGKTNNMLRRMKQLEPDELLDSVRCSNYHQLEREVQAQFKAVRIPQTEYYRLNKEQIKKVYELLRKGAK